VEPEYAVGRTKLNDGLECSALVSISHPIVGCIQGLTSARNRALSGCKLRPYRNVRMRSLSIRLDWRLFQSTLLKVDRLPLACRKVIMDEGRTSR